MTTAAQRVAAMRARRRAVKLCDCGNALQVGLKPDGKPYKNCPACLQRGKETGATAYANGADRLNAQAKDRRERNKERGRCTAHPKRKAVVDHTRCATCLREMRKYAKASIRAAAEAPA